MGRLFWKFFFSIWLAQAAAILAISGSIWLRDRNASGSLQGIDTSPPVSFEVRSALATLEYGGPEALRRLLRGMDRHAVYAVDEDNREILGRELDPALVARARSSAGEDAHLSAIRQMVADGHDYLLFVPREVDMCEPSPMPGRPGPLAWLFRGGPAHFPVMPMLVAMLASLVSAALLAWQFARPIRTLRSALDAASTGRLDQRVGSAMGRRRDELADLGRDFDRMAVQLQKLMDGQRRLLHDVSHELRSPLARLQAAIGLARQQPEKIEQSLERIEREGGRINLLVGELLTLSRVDAGVAGDMRQDVDLAELLAQVMDDARFEAEAQDKVVTLHESPPVRLRGNPELLHRAIENVVRNAVKYAPPGGTVEAAISIEKGTRYAYVSICNQGTGIPDAELEAIFTPFFRGVRARGKSEGHGLGLAIARRIVEAHHGSIRALNLVNQQFCIEIRLPLVGGGDQRAQA